MTLMMKIVFPALLLSTLALTACQHHQPAAAVTVAGQLSQLSAVVASASWLRQNCNRSDIPADDRLAASALLLAAERGWATPPDFRQQLAAQVASRMSALDADAPTLADKCAALNQSSAPFIHFTQKKESAVAAQPQ